MNRKFLRALIYSAICGVAFYLLLVYGWRTFVEADRALTQEIAESYESQEECLVGLYKDWCTSDTQDCKENVESYCKDIFPED